MSIKIVKNLVPSSKYSIKCPYPMTPKFIIVHNTYNDASAVNEIAYMIRNDLTTSFHYAVDDIQAVQGIEENRNSWNAGDGTNGNGNRNGIAIEICYSKSGGERFIKAEQNAVLLIVDILKRYGWGVDKIKKHQDFSGKYCPHRTLDMGWNRFIAMVSDALAPKPAPIVYPFPEGTIVYPIEDVNLVKTAGYTDQTKYLLKKGTKSKVIKYHNVHGLYMALGNEAGEFYTSAWSREFAKFTTTPPVKSCEEICEEKVGQVASEYLLKLEEQQRASEGLKKDIENKDMGILQLQKTVEEKDKEIEHLKKEIETGTIQMGNIIGDYEAKIEELEKVNLNLRKKNDMLNVGSVFTWEQIMKYVNSQEMKGVWTALSSLFRGISDLLDRLRNKMSG